MSGDHMVVIFNRRTARATLGCLYDRRAALVDHLNRSEERRLGQAEIAAVQERLSELDEAIDGILKVGGSVGP